MQKILIQLTIVTFLLISSFRSIHYMIHLYSSSYPSPSKTGYSFMKILSNKVLLQKYHHYFTLYMYFLLQLAYFGFYLILRKHTDLLKFSIQVFEVDDPWQTSSCHYEIVYFNKTTIFKIVKNRSKGEN